MNIFKRLFGKKRSDLTFENEEIQREAYAKALEIRQNNAELRRLNHQRKLLMQQREIEALKASISDLRGSDEEEDQGGGVEDQLLGVLLSKILAGGQNQQISGISEYNTSPPLIEAEKGLSDDEIRQLIETIPKKHRKMARGLPDQALKMYIQNQKLGYDEKTIDRAIQIFRSEKY